MTFFDKFKNKLKIYRDYERKINVGFKIFVVSIKQKLKACVY